jgi:hypothetical protein
VAGWMRRERKRIGALVEQGAPPWLMHRSVNQSRHAVRRSVLRLKRASQPEPVRSPLRLSLAEREEVWRGVAGGESLRAIALRLGSGTIDDSREVTAAAGAIGRARLIGRRCDAGGDRSRRSSRVVSDSAVSWRPNWSCDGHPSSSPGGCRKRSLAMGRCGCRTRRSTCRYSCKLEVRCARN